jgi:hypothetical protein
MWLYLLCGFILSPMFISQIPIWMNVHGRLILNNTRSSNNNKRGSLKIEINDLFDFNTVHIIITLVILVQLKQQKIIRNLHYR